MCLQAGYTQEKADLCRQLQELHFPACTVIDAGLPVQDLLGRLTIQLPARTCQLNLPKAVAACDFIMVSDLESTCAGQVTFPSAVGDNLTHTCKMCASIPSCMHMQEESIHTD